MDTTTPSPRLAASTDTEMLTPSPQLTTTGAETTMMESTTTKMPSLIPCPGITYASIKESTRIHDIEKVLKGFMHSCAEGVRNFADAISYRLPWYHRPPVIGVLRRDAGSTQDVWTINMLPEVGDEDHSNYEVRHVACTGMIAGDYAGGLCRQCQKKSSNFLRRCRHAVDVREKAFAPGNKSSNVNVMRSPTIVRKKLKMMSNENKRLASLMRCRADREKHGVKCDPRFNDIFNEETTKLAEKYFEEEEVGDDDLRKMIFHESVTNAKVARMSPTRRMGSCTRLPRVCRSGLIPVN
jgi:hypothetical protein